MRIKEPVNNSVSKKEFKKSGIWLCVPPIGDPNPPRKNKKKIPASKAAGV